MASDAFITDEEEQLMLIESRIHWAIKRNILKDTISEDLTYAQCIKNENEDLIEILRNKDITQSNINETRSLHSTPERRRSTQDDVLSV